MSLVRDRPLVDEVLDQAEAAVVETEALVVELDRTVLTGDPGVPPDEVQRALGLRCFAQLRIRDLRRRATGVRARAAAGPAQAAGAGAA